MHFCQALLLCKNPILLHLFWKTMSLTGDLTLPPAAPAGPGSPGIPYRGIFVWLDMDFTFSNAAFTVFQILTLSPGLPASPAVPAGPGRP